MEGSDSELQELTTTPDISAWAYGMKVNNEKDKVLLHARDQQSESNIMLIRQNPITDDGSSRKLVNNRFSLTSSATARFLTSPRRAGMSIKILL